MGKSSKTRRPYGSGSIRHLGDDRWAVEATSGRKGDGSKRRAKRIVHGDKADAELALLKLRTELGARPNMGDSMTLDEYFWGVYVPIREECIVRGTDNVIVVKGTLDTYKSVYRVHIAPTFGSWPADSIGRTDVSRWAAGLPSAATAAKAVRHLRAILRAMWDDELLDEKPLERRVRVPRHQVEPKDVWTNGELDEARERLVGHQMEGMVLAMAGGGIRREEALALNLPDDLAFDTTPGGHLVCRFTVRSAWVDGDRDLKKTKTYRVRTVTIGEPFSPRLREIANDGRPRLAMRMDGRAPLLPSSIPETWRRAFREGNPLHGMRYVELKTLRHLHESTAVKVGFNDSETASLHGHSQQVMYQNYLSVSSAESDRLAEAIRLEMERASSGAL